MVITQVLEHRVKPRRKAGPEASVLGKGTLAFVVYPFFKKVEKEKSSALWLHGLGRRMVILEAALEGYPRLPPSRPSSCWEQSEGGIIFPLVTLPRMRGNPQSVGFFWGGWGWGGR